MWISSLLATIPDTASETVQLGDLIGAIGAAIESFASVGGPEAASLGRGSLPLARVDQCLLTDTNSCL